MGGTGYLTGIVRFLNQKWLTLRKVNNTYIFQKWKA